MNNINSLLKITCVALLGGFLLSSCVKKTKEEDKDTDSAAENFLATTIANDMGSIADEAGRTKNVTSYKSASSNSESAILSACASLKFDSLVGSNPDTITVNFGSSNCPCNDGRSRRGVLLITYSGKYKDSLTTITITPKNYFVNDNAVTGSKTVQNLGHNAQGHLLYDINEHIVISKADGSGNISLDARRRREWLTGEGTLIWADDKYSITGSASGTNANGRTYISNITNPLIRDMALGCRKNFVSGTIEHTPIDKPARVLDFGDGACDDKATVNINGKVYDIQLP